MAQNVSSTTPLRIPKTYPRNVGGGALAPYILDSLDDHLNKHALRLFSDETRAALDFLDLGEVAKGMFHQAELHSLLDD